MQDVENNCWLFMSYIYLDYQFRFRSFLEDWTNVLSNRMVHVISCFEQFHNSFHLMFRLLGIKGRNH